MENKPRNWTRNETILAFELYCTIPSAKMTTENPQITALATALGRTANSIKLKLQNFKAFDPLYTADGRLGLSHGSKMDEQIVQEFQNDWDELVFNADIIREKMRLPVVDSVISEHNVIEEVGSDRLQLRKVRIGQSFFRKSLFAAYDGKCCITNLSIPELLRASHIKPWADTRETSECVNPRNGLLLNAFHDAAFDRGYITLNKKYEIVISTKISKQYDATTITFFGSYEGKKIILPSKFAPDLLYIEYHNDVIFKK